MVYLGFMVLTTCKKKIGGQIQLFIEGKIHWKCSVRKDVEDPVKTIHIYLGPQILSPTESTIYNSLHPCVFIQLKIHFFN